MWCLSDSCEIVHVKCVNCHIHQQIDPFATTLQVNEDTVDSQWNGTNQDMLDLHI